MSERFVKERRENAIKATLIMEGRKAFPGWCIFPHQDIITHGIPDISWTGNRHTAWTELKYADPNFNSKGIQELNMLKLVRQGIWARYIIYYEVGTIKRTYLVHPHAIGLGFGDWLDVVDGHNHQWVIEKIRGAYK